MFCLFLANLLPCIQTIIGVWLLLPVADILMSQYFGYEISYRMQHALVLEYIPFFAIGMICYRLHQGTKETIASYFLITLCVVSVLIIDGIEVAVAAPIRLFQYLLGSIVPRSVLEAKVMQSTARLHEGVANPVLQEADLVFHQPRAVHPTDRVFDTNADGRHSTIGRFRRWREFTSTRCFLRLGHRHPMERTSLEPQIVIETTPRGERIACEIREAFLLRLAFTGIA
jgi:hypothetical protein